MTIYEANDYYLDQNFPVEVLDKNLTMVILVGPPASGKSTWGKDYAQKNNFVYISTDKIRGEIGKGEDDQNVSPAAFMIAQKRVTESLSLGKSVVIDATNINHQFRKKWIKLGREYDATIVAVVFEVNRDELVKRDTERERHVGLDVIDKYLSLYVRPDENEVDKVILNPK